MREGNRMLIETFFELQFDPSEIDGLVTRYQPAQDDEALAAGKRLAAGHYDRETLKTIVRWKSKRRIALIDDNSDSAIAATLRLAGHPDTPEVQAVGALTLLHGVGIPMASAILMAMQPKKYTVLDYHALASLGVAKWRETAEFYLAYRNFCRELAARLGITMRDLDRALVQWDSEREQQKRCDHGEDRGWRGRRPGRLRVAPPSLRRNV